jgi:hypothetical protein
MLVAATGVEPASKFALVHALSARTGAHASDATQAQAMKTLDASVEGRAGILRS